MLPIIVGMLPLRLLYPINSVTTLCRLPMESGIGLESALSDRPSILRDFIFPRDNGMLPLRRLNPRVKQFRGISRDSSFEIKERLSIHRVASSGLEENGVEDEEDKEACGWMIRHSEFENNLGDLIPNYISI
ncbi:hypothetical protein SASPL_153113 [Salvia splendens]|uniref:Uncharacterized protein n=1 Tax=Salvia splendens TaxID=180675 RepID=A0A8X8W4L1_SALSN|nr:hypothetical protein SASPL_153113 [Salvia splendens]